MTLPVLRPMTIAAATGLVAGALASCTIVYADEDDRQGGDFYDKEDNDVTQGGHPYQPFDKRYHRPNYPQQPSPSGHGGYHRLYLNQQHSKTEQNEDLVPGLVYVALAGISGSVIARQRNVLIRVASPLAFATAAGAYFLPNTTHALLDPVIGGSSPVSSSIGPKGSKDTTSASMPMTSELTSRAREAWHQTESRAQDIRERGQIRGVPQRQYIAAQHETDDEPLDHAYKNTQSKKQPIEHSSDNSSWFQISRPTKATDNIDDAEQALKAQAKEARHWWDRRTDEAKDKLEEIQGKAKETQRDAKGWMEDQRSEADATLGQAKDHLKEKAAETREDAKQWWSRQSSNVEDKASELKSQAKGLDSKVKEAAQETKHWWHNKSSEAGEKAHELEEKAAETTKEVKHWWNRTSTNAGEKVKELEDQAKETTDDVKHWWNKRSTEADQKMGEIKEKAKDVSHQAGETLNDLKEKSKEVKSWVETKTHDAGKVAEDVSAKASDAVHKTKEWVDEKQTQVDKKLEASVQDADAWWKAQAEAEAAKEKEQLAKERKEAEKQWWFQRRPTEGRASSTQDSHHDDGHHRKHWWSSRKRAADTGIATTDVAGEKMGSAHAPSLSTTPSAYISSDSFMDGLLDSKDVSDHWTSEDQAGKDRQDTKTQDQTLVENGVHLLTRPQEPEYWSNGEEIGTANVRDANYYNYQGSFTGSSLGRTSWWSRRISDSEQAVSSLKDKAESLVWETKLAAERSAIELADQLAHEQAVLEQSAAEARVRAEEAARRARAQSDLLLRERQAAVERAAKEMEARLAAEKAATERAAAEVKARATAWEDEQRSLAEQAAKAIEDRVAHEKRAADLTAEQLKARAEAWARDQKEQAELTAKEVHNRVKQETATAEKHAREAKAALDARLKAEKLETERVTRELQERIRLQKFKEEAAHEEAKPATSGWSWPWSSSKAPAKEEEKPLKEAAPTERRSWWTSGSTTITPSGKPTELARNVQAAAIKAEQDVKTRASQQGKNMDDTAKKAYDNVVDAASTVHSQLSESHAAIHGHEHGSRGEKSADNEGYHLIDHLREDYKQTKDDIQHGVEKLKEAVFGAEQETQKAKEEGKKWWANKTEQVDGQLNKTKEQVDKAVDEGKGWWNTKTKEVEGEVKAGLNKAGEKLREMDREAKDSEAEFWLKTEQRRQQSGRRESGRAM